MALNKKLDTLHLTVQALRRDVDTHRILLSRKKAIKAHDTRVFFDYVMGLALTSVAMNACKIYEKKDPKYPLCSIHAILDDLPEDLPADNLRDDFQRFAQDWGGKPAAATGVGIIRSAYNAFEKRHKGDLEVLKTFRNKVAAHSEFLAEYGTLSSRQVLEQLWQFPDAAYHLMRKQYVKGQAVAQTPVAQSLLKTLQSLGIKDESAVTF